MRLVDLDPALGDGRARAARTRDRARWARRPVAIKQPIGGERLAACKVHVHARLDPVDRRSQAKLDALLEKRVGEQLGRVGMIARDQAFGHVHDRDRAPHPPEELGQLTSHRAGADHDQALRHRVGGGGLTVRPVVHAVEPLDRGNRRQRSGRDHQPLDTATSRSPTATTPGRSTRASPRTSDTRFCSSHSSWELSSPPPVT